jgi:bla regulator protein blaR1
VSASAVLLAFAVTVAVVAPVLLRRAAWLDFSPRIGIVLWQLATVSALVSFVAGAATLCLTLWSGATPAVFLRTCFALLGQGEMDSPMMLIGSAGVMAAAVAGLRLAYCAGRTALGIGRERCRQRRRLALVGHRDAAWPDAVVIDRPEATAFCLPGRRGGTVVLSTGTLARLAPGEVHAVLAHERAHLRGRHDLVVWAARSLREAFPFVPLFRAAADALPGLVEMAADDVASRHAGRRVLASALLGMAEASTPAFALGVGGSTITCRVRRLVQPRPAGRLRGAAALTGGLVLVGAPMATFAVAVATGCQFVMST